MFGKDLVHLKGLKSGVTGIFYKALKRRERNGDLVVVTIDEHLTSQICCKCMTRTLDVLSSIRGCSVLVCKTCRTLWQRDVNASLNMMKIAQSTWRGEGRPPPFKRG